VRALIVGDIHTEDGLLAAAVAEGQAAGVDRFLSVGDIVDGPGDVLACFALLRRHGFTVVAGNHERWTVRGHGLMLDDYPADELAWMRGLPPTCEIPTPSGLLLLGHGVGDDDMVRLHPYTTGYALECVDALWQIVRAGRHRWLVGGHTHVPMVRSFDRLTVLNPGTLVRDEEPGYLIADFARGEIERWTLLPRPARQQRWSVEL
jgi:predicted phosphodiesterase